MDRLPKETFITITSHLKLSDKVQCALVSRKWYEMLVNDLYSTLTFSKKTPKNLYDAIAMFVEREKAAQQVTDLQIVQYGAIDPHAVLSMPRYFHNVKFLTWFDGRIDHLKNPTTIHTYPPKPLYAAELRKWYRLKEITAVNGSVEMGYFPFTISLLGIFSF